MVTLSLTDTRNASLSDLPRIHSWQSATPRGTKRKVVRATADHTRPPAWRERSTRDNYSTGFFQSGMKKVTEKEKTSTSLTNREYVIGGP